MGAWALALLSGCSASLLPPDLPTPLEAGPGDYQAVVAKDVGTLANRATLGPLEISALRRTRLTQPGDWVACVRAVTEERPTYFAVFIRDGRVIDRRLAVLVDECGQEQYQPLAEAK